MNRKGSGVMSRTKTAYNYKMRKTYCCNISVGERELLCSRFFFTIDYKLQIKNYNDDKRVPMNSRTIKSEKRLISREKY